MSKGCCESQPRQTIVSTMVAKSGRRGGVAEWRAPGIDLSGVRGAAEDVNTALGDRSLWGGRGRGSCSSMPLSDCLLWYQSQQEYGLPGTGCFCLILFKPFFLLLMPKGSHTFVNRSKSLSMS